MGCDDAFWQVYRFSFLDGKPFASAEFLSGMPCVVLDRSLARRLLGRTEVAGQTVLINDIEYTISGVVEDISAVASDVYAEAWVPYTSMASIMDTALRSGKARRDCCSPTACCVTPRTFRPSPPSWRRE